MNGRAWNFGSTWTGSPEIIDWCIEKNIRPRERIGLANICSAILDISLTLLIASAIAIYRYMSESTVTLLAGSLDALAANMGDSAARVTGKWHLQTQALPKFDLVAAQAVPILELCN